MMWNSFPLRLFQKRFSGRFSPGRKRGHQMAKFYDSNDENNLHGELSAMLTIHALRDQPELLKQIMSQDDNVDVGAVHKQIRSHNHENLKKLGIGDRSSSSKLSSNPETRAKQRSGWDQRELSSRARSVMQQMSAAKENINGGR
jgi:hypothetical protein